MDMPNPTTTMGLIKADFVQRLGRYLARRIRVPEDRDDVVQEAITRVLARVRRGDLPASDLEPYAFRVASNLAIDRYRRKGADYVELPETLASEAPEPHRQYAAREELKVMAHVIQDMPQLRQDVFLAVRIEGLSHKEVSDKFGLSRKAIEKHMSRALADIVKARRQLKQEE